RPPACLSNHLSHTETDPLSLHDALPISYTPIPVTELMKDQDHVNIPGEPELRVAKKADKTKGITLKKGRYQGTRKPGTYYEGDRSEEHTSELQSRFELVCRLLLEKKKHR